MEHGLHGVHGLSVVVDVVKVGREGPECVTTQPQSMEAMPALENHCRELLVLLNALVSCVLTAQQYSESL